MIRSASDEGQRQKYIYLAVSIVTLSFTIYFDYATISSNDFDVDTDSNKNDKTFKSTTGRKNEFVPIFTGFTFLVLVLVGIFSIGTREKWESENEAMGGVSSAYSVFNRGGKAILGAMSAKELDGQLRGGPVGGYGAETNDEAPSSDNMTSGLIRRRPIQHQRKGAPSKMPDGERKQERLRRERAEAATRRMGGTMS